jgi:hypothetical protein
VSVREAQPIWTVEGGPLLGSVHVTQRCNLCNVGHISLTGLRPCGGPSGPTPGAGAHQRQASADAPKKAVRARAFGAEPKPWVWPLSLPRRAAAPLPASSKPGRCGVLACAVPPPRFALAVPPPRVGGHEAGVAPRPVLERTQKHCGSRVLWCWPAPGTPGRTQAALAARFDARRAAPSICARMRWRRRLAAPNLELRPPGELLCAVGAPEPRR